MCGNETTAEEGNSLTGGMKTCEDWILESILVVRPEDVCSALRSSYF
jgi:hypothetical protein